MTGQLPAARTGRTTEIQYCPRLHLHGCKTLDQFTEGLPVHEIRIVEAGRRAVESSLHVAKYR